MRRPALTERSWQLKYTPDDGDLVARFYVPALECAVQYDRSTGYFSASALALAVRGIEGLVRNGGRMRLIVGCTLEPDELAAIERGEALRDSALRDSALRDSALRDSALRDALERRLAACPLDPLDEAARDALELVAWMIEHDILAVKLAVPCDDARRPIAAGGIFHEKAGVIEDADGNRLAFNGSINETYAGWQQNWESFNVFTSWSGTAEHAAREAEDFATLWADRARRVRTLDVPAAVRADLLRFMPAGDRPARLALPLPQLPAPKAVRERPPDQPPPPFDLRRAVWQAIAAAPTVPHGGERVGEATCPVVPWPHQVRAFERLYATDAPRLLIADEVGLGKTIQAGMLLRQMWLAGRAKRVLVLTPAAVMRQWQLELREKFNLNWPLYEDGCLRWAPSPALAALGAAAERPVGRDAWHREPFLIASSHLMRRRDRERELCEDAEPWDLVVLDEAHHARRRGAGSAAEEGPNELLRLMRRLTRRTRGLLLLTATPMQVHPVELWDLLDLLGLPPAWNAPAFVRFFELAGRPSPSHEEFDELAAMFRAAEAAFGATTGDELSRLSGASGLGTRRIADALRGDANTPRRRLEVPDRVAAIRVMRGATPVARLVSRHTRDLLRHYHRAGTLATPIAERAVRDEFIEMAPAERAVYDAVERYVSTTYDAASANDRNAVGFIMTVYRRRVASSFRALRTTLEARLASEPPREQRVTALDDASDDEASGGEVMDASDVLRLRVEAQRRDAWREERSSIDALLRAVQALPPDTKARRLKAELDRLGRDGHERVMVFTQFTDTMDFLREFLGAQGVGAILCFSGRGGEALGTDGRWSKITRDEVKERFRGGRAQVLLCTDAAAEGLNFQFCGALVNYDMPWNPMRVEQRIGRIDRLGQQHPVVQIVNLHYADTVESDVYKALGTRIRLFESVVGRLQPILAQLPRTIADTVLRRGGATPDARERVAAELASRVDTLARDPSAFDLDALAADSLTLPPRPAPALDLEALGAVLRRSDLLPPGVAARPLDADVGYRAPGMRAEVRVTTDAAYYEEHAESVELWSPGSPLFPDAAVFAGGGETSASVAELLNASQ